MSCCLTSENFNKTSINLFHHRRSSQQNKDSCFCWRPAPKHKKFEKSDEKFCVCVYVCVRCWQKFMNLGLIQSHLRDTFCALFWFGESQRTLIPNWLRFREVSESIQKLFWNRCEKYWCSLADKYGRVNARFIHFDYFANKRQKEEQGSVVLIVPNFCEGWKKN